MNQNLKKALWAAADRLHSSMDAAEYKHIVLGLIFLKYIRDAFDERRAQLRAEFADAVSELHLPDADDHAEALEERGDYTMANSPFNDSGWRGELLKDDKRLEQGGLPVVVGVDTVIYPSVGALE